MQRNEARGFILPNLVFSRSRYLKVVLNGRSSWRLQELHVQKNWFKSLRVMSIFQLLAMQRPASLRRLITWIHMLLIGIKR